MMVGSVALVKGSCEVGPTFLSLTSVGTWVPCFPGPSAAVEDRE